MSLANAGVEIPALAEKAGFTLVSTHRDEVAYFHYERYEGFRLRSEDGMKFISADWVAANEWIAVVDKRSEGEYGERSGVSLAGNAKRRPVGMSEVRPEMRTSARGLPTGYMETKRRIRNKDWRMT